MILCGSQCIERSAFAVRYYIPFFHCFIVLKPGFLPGYYYLFINPFTLATKTRQRSKFSLFCAVYSSWECSKHNLIACYDSIPFSRVRSIYDAFICPVSYGNNIEILNIDLIRCFHIYSFLLIKQKAPFAPKREERYNIIYVNNLKP